MYARAGGGAVEGVAAGGWRMRVVTRKKLIAAVAVAASAAALAATAAAQADREGSTLVGQVVDASTHALLDSVQVKVKGTELRGTTDGDGTFSIEKVPGEKVSILISRSGYKSREINIKLIDATTKWTVALWKSR